MTARRRIVLHIGTEKTGSTALQGALYRHRALLMEHGVAYCHSPGRQEARGIAAAALGNKAPDDYLRQLNCESGEAREAFRRREVEALQSELASLPASVHTVILSSEHFHSRLRQPAQLVWLKDVLEPFASSFEVVVYLRRQVDLLASFYSTQLKNGGTLALEETGKRVCHPRNHYYNYRKVIELWADVFGAEALRVRLFTSDFLQGRSIQEDFLSALECPEAMSAPERHNESLIPAGQVMLRALNKRLGELSDDAEDEREALNALRAGLVREYKGSGQLLEPSQAAQIQAAFEPGNEWVRQAYFSAHERLFEPVAENYGAGRERLTAISETQLELAERVVEMLGRGIPNDKPVPLLDPCANWFRDLAVQLEKHDPRVALRLMALAHRIRPQGPFIARKMTEYQQRLDLLSAGPFRSLVSRLRRFWSTA